MNPFSRQPEVTVIGWGNGSRGDDGLGPALADAIARCRLAGIAVETGQELRIDHAASIAASRRVVFIDASYEGPAPFLLQTVEPELPLSLSSHLLSPGGVVWIAQVVFGSSVSAIQMAVRGYAFEESFEGLSERAQENLIHAYAFLRQHLLHEQASVLATPPA